MNESTPSTRVRPADAGDGLPEPAWTAAEADAAIAALEERLAPKPGDLRMRPAQLDPDDPAYWKNVDARIAAGDFRVKAEEDARDRKLIATEDQRDVEKQLRRRAEKALTTVKERDRRSSRIGAEARKEAAALKYDFLREKMKELPRGTRDRPESDGRWAHRLEVHLKKTCPADLDEHFKPREGASAFDKNGIPKPRITRDDIRAAEGRR